jgi:c-di-GMP-binding flagellar brake protein YcgR
VSSLLDRRNHKRLFKRFQASVKIARTAAEIEGVTENISQGGALISSQSLPSFQKNEEAIVQLFLPPEMTGQQSTLVLGGPAVVRRVEKEQGGIALQFQKGLRAFEASMCGVSHIPPDQ